MSESAPDGVNMKFTARIHEINLMIARMFNRQVDEVGLTRAQWQVLRRLYIEGQQSQTQLANTLLMAKPPLGKIIDKLEKDGWVTRHQNPTDRRENLVVLTEKVSPLIEPLDEITTQISDAAMATLSAKERDQLESLLATVHDNLSVALPLSKS